VIGDRVILYVHGGAFFFSSLDTHRYQVQRHARKAGARAFCPAYRLAPQYPFVSKDLASALHQHHASADEPTRSHAASSMSSRLIFIFCILLQVHTSRYSRHPSS
jgi:acetyl esterase/lipase